jgi:AAA+ ATPase superfamily predicted ATPase
MPRFVDRETELASLDRFVARSGSQFIVVYGRRRVGKTTLLLHWAKHSGLPYIYWVASRNTGPNLRQDLAETLWQYEHPDEPAYTAGYLPESRSWRDLFRYAARFAADERLVLILDELPYAIKADGALPFELQNAWDHDLQATNLVLIVSGSHVGMMVRMQEYQAPLYGRFTARLPVEPLPFYACPRFCPAIPRRNGWRCRPLWAVFRPIWSGSTASKRSPPTYRRKSWPTPACFASSLFIS